MLKRYVKKSRSDDKDKLVLATYFPKHAPSISELGVMERGHCVLMDLRLSSIA